MPFINYLKNYTSSFFICRTPNFPLVRLFDFFDKIRDINSDNIGPNLKKIYSDTFLLESVYISSPNFYEYLLKYLNNEISNEKDLNRIQITLLLFFIRICSRCTPFGLFSSISVGYFAETESYFLKPLSELKIHMTFDTEYLLEFSLLLRSHANIKYFSKYFFNSSTYVVGKKRRFTEQRLLNNRLENSLIAIDNDRNIQFIERLSTDGISYNLLVEEISKKGYDRNDAEIYIDQLIESQLLISELELRLSGPDFSDVLFEFLKKLPIEFEKFGADFLNSKKRLNDLKDKGELSLYIEFLKSAEKGKLSPLFKLDSTRPTVNNKLNKTLIKPISDGIEILSKLNTNNYTSKLEEFKKSFYQLFENQSVPLLKALDPELGINYNDILYQMPHLQGSEASSFKFSKFTKAMNSNEREIYLNGKEVEEIRNNPLPLPDSFNVLIRPIKEESRTIINFINSTGPSGINLFGRFCLNNEDLNSEVLKHIEMEEALESGKIFAEIVHIGNTNATNISARPRLRRYEIGYLGESGIDAKFKIKTSELYLKLMGGRMILFSKKLNKEIVPRLSTAHNFNTSTLGVYKFLCDLQYQGVQNSLSWDWGHLNNEPFLPRVRYKDTILSPSTWLLDYAIINRTNDEKGQNIKLKFDSYKAKVAIPDLVCLSNGENELLLDLRVEMCLNYVIKELKSKKVIRLKEYYAPNENNLVYSVDGSYASEFIVPFIRRNEREKSFAERHLVSNSKVNAVRVFPPGSIWVYFKVYATSSILESLLKEELYQFALKETKNKTVEKWFFIRYQDPNDHVRIRFQLTKIEKFTSFISNFNKQFEERLNDGFIKSIQLDTYKRELERYLPENIAESETLFYINSITTIKLIKLTNDINQRMIVGSFGVYMILKCFNFSFNSAMSFCNESFEGYKNEFREISNKEFREKMQYRYREASVKLKSFISMCLESPIAINDPVYKIFYDQNQLLIPVVQKFYLNVKTLVQTREIVHSYIHMFINRLFATNQRQKEYIIYYYLTRYYESQYFLTGDKLNKH